MTETNVQAATPAEGETAPVENTAPATEPNETNEAQAEVKPQEQDQEGDEAGEDTGEEKPRKKSGIQRLKAREAYLRNENSELQRRLEALEQRTKAATPSAEDQPPSEDDFKGDYFAYERALQAYNIRKVIREEKARDAEAQNEARRSEVRRELEIAHHERVADAMDPESPGYIADYAEAAAKMKGVNISAEVAEAIIESEKSALLAYYLANNPERLRELNALSSRQLAREIGRLEGSVRMPAARRQTTATAPLAPLKGGATPVRTDLDLAKGEDVSALIKQWRSKKKSA